MAVPAWLSDAVLYQIYPQSFADSDGDGIGDLRGIAEHLDYLAWLGVTAVWLNPCFVSPMRDAGYDVADYFTVDPRYGDNDDLAELADQARMRGIRLLLDLVPGHTADTHPWFAASAHDPGDHRYIWAGPGPDGGRLPEGFVRSPGSRPGGYLPNFFDFQPALNFGYARQEADEPWRQSVEAEGPRANRAAVPLVVNHLLAGEAGAGPSGRGWAQRVPRFSRRESRAVLSLPAASSATDWRAGWPVMVTMVCGSSAPTMVWPASARTTTLHGSSRPMEASMPSARCARGGLQAPRIR